MLWATGPACTEVETVMLDWLADLLDLPAEFRSSSSGGGVIQDSASSATLVATLAALHRASSGGWRTDGVDRRYTVYTSTQGHSSIEKAARIAGLGDAGMRLIEVDSETLAMSPGSAARGHRGRRGGGRGAGAWWLRRSARRRPPRSTRCERSARSAGKHGVWLHVDAAYAGVGRGLPGAAMDPRRRRIGRLLLLRPAQVAADRIRLRRILGRRPGGADPGAVGAPGVPTQRRDRVGRRHRLPRLAGATGPAVPGVEAVVRPSLVRRRGPAGAHPFRRRARPRSSRAGYGPTTASRSSRRTRSRWSASGCARRTR